MAMSDSLSCSNGTAQSGQAGGMAARAIVAGTGGAGNETISFFKSIAGIQATYAALQAPPSDDEAARMQANLQVALRSLENLRKSEFQKLKLQSFNFGIGHPEFLSLPS